MGILKKLKTFGLVALLFQACNNKEEIYNKESFLYNYEDSVLLDNKKITRIINDLEMPNIYNLSYNNKRLKNIQDSSLYTYILKEKDKKIKPIYTEIEIPSSAKKVSTGWFEYNKCPLYSGYFFGCSAIILDYGDDAFFAHAYPNDKLRWKTKDKAIEILIQESKKRNLNPEESFAVVHAGTEQSLKDILFDLKKNNIPIRIANRLSETLDDSLNEKHIPRNVLYFPKSDSLIVYIDSSCINYFNNHRNKNPDVIFSTY